jgi:hypothetical protein
MTNVDVPVTVLFGLIISFDRLIVREERPNVDKVSFFW